MWVVLILIISKINPSLPVLGILSHEKNYDLRQAIRQTWAKTDSCNIFFLVDLPTHNLSNEKNQFEDIVFLHSKYHGRANRFGEKLYKWLQIAHQLFPNAPWIGKCDDDVFVNIDKFVELIKPRVSPLMYCGWLHGIYEKAPSKMNRIDEAFVVVGQTLAKRISRRRYCKINLQCDLEDLIDTNFGGTSLGHWLSIYNDVIVVKLNKYITLNSKQNMKVDVTESIIINGLKTKNDIIRVAKNYNGFTNGATGKIWTENVDRSLPKLYFQNWNQKIQLISNKTKCKYWGVVTTINAPTQAVKRLASHNNWCIVIVGDIQGPGSYNINGNTFFLSAEKQNDLNMKTMNVLPWRHFGRKNIGYIFAVSKGATLIFDFDDDNSIRTSMHSFFLEKEKTTCLVDSSYHTHNPYSIMGATSVDVPWPRGLPLSEYHTKRTRRSCTLSTKSNAIIWQSLANNDPDVDAIYRFTRQLPFSFTKHEPIEIAKKVFVPYNAQASFHAYDAFWALLLPITVSGRVSDIWRSYMAQPLIWCINSTVAFLPSLVTQYRNAHNYLADFDAEQHLYLRSNQLISFLRDWKCTAVVPSIPSCMELLWAELYQRGYLDLDDVRLVQLWLRDLKDANYTFPVVNQCTS